MTIALFIGMISSTKKILIIDEDGFSKVCSAILNDEGYQTKLAVSAEEAVRHVSGGSTSLVVSSYPYALPFMRLNSVKDIPAILLSDELSDDLIEIMRESKNSICLVKPVDFDRFRYIVRGIINGYLNFSGGNIIA